MITPGCGIGLPHHRPSQQCGPAAGVRDCSGSLRLHIHWHPITCRLTCENSVTQAIRRSEELPPLFYYLLKYVLLGPLLRLVFRPRIEGLENVPASGPAIVAGNHLSFSDHFLMPAILKRRITFLAKAEYFTGPGIKGRLTAAFFRSAGQIPVDRSGKDAGQAAIREGLGVLRKGELLGIYPEGTRSHDGRLYKGKVGVAVMALKAGVPVVPCAMIGTFEAQPPGKVIPNIHPVVIRFGKPLDFSRYAGMEDEKAILRAVTDEIMYAILSLSEQEYVDQYAAVVKADEAAAKGERERKFPRAPLG